MENYSIAVTLLYASRILTVFFAWCCTVDGVVCVIIVREIMLSSFISLVLLFEKLYWVVTLLWKCCRGSVWSGVLLMSKCSVKSRVNSVLIEGLKVIQRCSMSCWIVTILPQIFELLKSTIARSYRDAERCRLSHWVHDLVPFRADIAEQVLETIKNRCDICWV